MAHHLSKSLGGNDGALPLGLLLLLDLLQGVGCRDQDLGFGV